MSDIFNRPIQFVNDYIERLRSAEPLDDLSKNPIMQADDRYVKEMQSSLENLKFEYDKTPAAALNTDKRQELADLFLERQKYLKDLGGEEVQTFSDRLNNWEKETGLSFDKLNIPDFGGLQHETVSHHLPYLRGFSPDIEEKNIEQFKLKASPASPLNEVFAGGIDNAIRFGEQMDLKSILGDKESLDKFYKSQGAYAAEMSGKEGQLNEFERASMASNPFNETNIVTPRGNINYDKLSDVDAELALRLNTANKFLDQKFIQPLIRRYENLGAVQAPFEISRDFLPSYSTEYSPSLLPGYGGEAFRGDRGLSVEETNYNRLLNLAQNLKQYSNLKYGGAGNLLFSLDPASAAIEGARGMGRDINTMSKDATEWWNKGRDTRVPDESNASWKELLRDDRSQLTRTDAAFEAGETGLKGFRPLKAFTPRMIKTGPTPAVRQAFERPTRAVLRNPASLLPGLADLIPSPEAIQTGYKQGPAAMGQQMGREFVQNLPTSAAFAGALSTPVLAPFAPGVGLGFVGSAAVRAANEVVRQQTGEGIVPKVRQFIGTAPRTGVANKPRMVGAPLTAEIKPLSAQGKAEMNRRQNRNELQRRLDLVKERFNPRKGDFSFSEFIFGR